MLLRNVQCGRVIGLSPSVHKLLIGSVAADFGEESVEILLQLSTVQREAGAYRDGWQSGTDRIQPGGKILVEDESDAFAARDVYLSGFQGGYEVRIGGHSLNVGSRCHVGNSDILDAANYNSHIFPVQGLEGGGDIGH